MGTNAPDSVFTALFPDSAATTGDNAVIASIAKKSSMDANRCDFLSVIGTFSLKTERS